MKQLDIDTDKVLDIGGGALPVRDRVKKWNVNEYKILDNNLEKEVAKDFVDPDFELDINKPWF